MKAKFNQLVEKYGKTKVYGACAGIGVGVVLMITLAIVIVNGSGSSSDNLALKQDQFTVEYGKKISKDPETYLKTTDGKILNEAKISFYDDKKTDKDGKDVYTEDYKKQQGKTYPAVGSYIVRVEYKEETKDFKVNVKDRTKPVFKDFKEEIEVQQGDTSVNFKTYFAATDLSKVTITVDSSDVKLNKPGTYGIKVTASDKYGNKVTKKSSVVVIEKAKPTPEPEKPVEVKPKPKVCTGQTVVQSTIGNSGLVFTTWDEYKKWDTNMKKLKTDNPDAFAEQSGNATDWSPEKVKLVDSCEKEVTGDWWTVNWIY